MTEVEAKLRAEISRLNKVIVALMDRAERGTDSQVSDFSLFQRALILDELVKERTVDLESALRNNEKINRALRDSEARYRAVVNQSPVGIAIISPDRILLQVNRVFCDVFGLRQDEVQGQSVRVFYGSDDMSDEFDRKVDSVVRAGETFSGDIPMQRRDGIPMTVKLACRLIDDAEPSLGAVCVVEDITERLRIEAELCRLATTDALTGILNRRSFMTNSSIEVNRSKRHKRPLSVLMLDIDNFKRVNDTYGHPVGDEAIKAMATTCAKTIRANDILSRLGGEEFAILLPETDLSNAIAMAERLRAAIADIRIPTEIGELSFTSSIGVAELTEVDPSIETLLSHADAALYEAKRSGRNRVMAKGG